MTEHGSAIDLSVPEPFVAPPLVDTSQHGDIEMAELETSGGQPCDEPTVNEETGDQNYDDQPMGDQPTDDQNCDDQPMGDQPTDEQHVGDQPTHEQHVGDQPTDEQNVGDQPTDEQHVGDQPTDEQHVGDQPTDEQHVGDQPTDEQNAGGEPTDNKPARPAFTAVSLIAEVQKYPLIFEKDYKTFFEKESKRKEWDYVCEGLFPQWSTFSASKKKRISKKVEKKWTKIREPFFKSYEGIRNRLTRTRNFGTSFSILNMVTDVVTHGGGHLTHEEMVKRNEQELNANMEQNVSREEGVHGMNPMATNVPLVEIPETFVQAAAPSASSVPSTSSQDIGNQGHVPEIATVAMPSTSFQDNGNQGHIPGISTRVVPTTSTQNYQGQNDDQVPIPVYQQNQSGFQYIPPPPLADHQYISINQIPTVRYIPVPLPADGQTYPITNEHGVWVNHNDLNQNIKSASIICAMFNKLDYNQQFAVWPKLIAMLSNASKSKPKKIKILQGELLDPAAARHSRIPATGPEIILQDPFVDTELEEEEEEEEEQEPFVDTELEEQEPFADPQLVAQEPFANPQLVAQEPFADTQLVAQEPFAEPGQGIQQTLATEQETAKLGAGGTEKECIYPSRYGRPTNAQGEIMYPETDPEDFDED